MTMCVFCDIWQGRLPAIIVHRWPNTMSIVPLNPVVDGHLLVIPREHVEDAAVSPSVTALTFARASEIAVRPFNLITSAGREATQSIFHLHVHVVPRREHDGLALPWCCASTDHQTSARDSAQPGRGGSLVAAAAVAADGRHQTHTSPAREGAGPADHHRKELP